MPYNEKNSFRNTLRPSDKRLETLERGRILRGEWLSDISVHQFHYLLSKCSDYRPRDTLFVQNYLNDRICATRIEPVPYNQVHLQIIYTKDHWICIYYDTKYILVLNSMSREFVTQEEEVAIRSLFPYFNELPLKYPKVAQQKNYRDCSLYAMAFATSIFFKEDPTKIEYDNKENKMRKHFYEMWDKNCLIRFPEVSSCNTFMPHSKNYNVSYMNFSESILKPIPATSVLYQNLKNVQKSTSQKLNFIDENTTLLTNHINRDISNKNSDKQWILKPLPNYNISCYANSVVQSLFHIRSLREKLSKETPNNELEQIFMQYINNEIIDDQPIYKLRGFANVLYKNCQQQCAAEFLNYLYEKLFILQDTVSVQLKFEVICSNHNREPNPCIFKHSDPIGDYSMFKLYIPSYSQNHTVQSLINFNLQSRDSEGRKCNLCHSTTYDVQKVGKIGKVLILHLAVFSTDSFDVTRKIIDFSIKNPINDIIQVAGEYFKVISIIFHQGPSVKAGHYTNLLRDDNDGWVKVDDDKKAFNDNWTCESKQPYLIFLEKVNKDVKENVNVPQKNLNSNIVINNESVVEGIIQENRKRKMGPIIKNGNCDENKYMKTSESIEKETTNTKPIKLDPLQKNKDELLFKVKKECNESSQCESNLGFDNLHMRKLIESKENTCNKLINSSKMEEPMESENKYNNKTESTPLKPPKKRKKKNTHFRFSKRKKINKIYYKKTLHNKSQIFNELNVEKTSQYKETSSETKISHEIRIGIKIYKNSQGEYESVLINEPKEKSYDSCKTASASMNEKKMNKRKWNKAYYQKNKNKDPQTARTRSDINYKYYTNHKSEILDQRKKRLLKKIETSENITKKYDNMRLQPLQKLLLNRETYIQRACNNLEDSSETVRRMSADNLITTCIYARERLISTLKSNLSRFKNKIEIALSRLGGMSIDNNEKCALTALCGDAKHSASSESYFQTSFDFEKIRENSTVLIIDEKGKLKNILPLIQVENGQKNGPRWCCDDFCKSVNPDILKELKILFEEFLGLTFVEASRYLKKILECSAEGKNPSKRGHPIICYMNPLTCTSKFLKLQVLSFHFPKLRTLKRTLYSLKKSYNQIDNIEVAIKNGDVDEMKKFLKEHENAPVISVNNEVCLNENILRETMQEALEAYHKVYSDPPSIPCISCQRLFSKKPIVNAAQEKLKVMNIPGKINYGKQLLDYCKQSGIKDETMCKYCYTTLKDDRLPSMCVLNELDIPALRKELAELNNFEKMLLQRAKCFQTVVKMGTVMKKNMPHYAKIDKVQGRTFHLPLPLDETLKKICPDTDPLNTDTNIFIIVRSYPTKKHKIIWENIVDIKKVWRALHCYKGINPIYSQIIIPLKHEDLLHSLKNEQLEYEIAQDKIENDNENPEMLSDDENSKISKANSKSKAGALLTQKDEGDPFYDQFTIYPLHNEKINEKDSRLYQMLQVYANSYDSRARDLDIKCFPDLFPTGKFGQHDANRKVKLRESDFIKSRLTSRDPRFRLNIQYLFFCLYDSTLRQVSAGIFHKLNITNPKNMCTAAELLEKLNKGQLEDSMTSIFARLPGTHDYWKRVRNDLNCMTREYGPATWFITLSPGEWMWPGMAEYIRKVNNWKNDKRSASELIAVDPVSAVGYFNNTFQSTLAYILSASNPIEKVVHYYYSVEFQGRGIPHYHCLFWVLGAPTYGISNNEEVAKFVLDHITCRIPNKKESPDLHRKVMAYQTHTDNSYCQRQIKTKAGVHTSCRFGFPRPVTKQIVLRSVSEGISNRRKLKKKNKFYDLPRSLNERFINDYMPRLLLVWEGNMDAQYIPESSYTLASYITKYNTKGEKGTHEVNFSEIQNNKPLISRLWSFAHKVLNHRECGALEAAYSLLSISLHGTDPATMVKWLDVRQIRNRKVKPYNQIKNMDPESTDLFFNSFIDTYYPNRPKSLEEMCLYDFARWFEVDKTKPGEKSKIEYYPMLIKGFYCKKRNKAYLINHWEYNSVNQPENYYYALLLLFQPWRDTDELKGNEATYTEAFRKKQSDLAKAMKYHDKPIKIREAMSAMEELVEKEMAEEKTEDQQDNDIFPDGCVPIETEILMKEIQDIADNVILDENELVRRIEQLNPDQRRVFDKITTAINSSDKPCRMFVSGFGGTGKSFVIELLAIYNKIKCLKDTAITAPTGVASYNVKGLTIHRLLTIPVKQGGTAHYKELAAAALKVIRENMEDINLLIIDEISMVSNLLLLYIHLRLCEIYNTSNCDDPYFGKIHIILFGDLLQLPPVTTTCEDFPFVKLSKENVEKFVGGMDSCDLWSLFEYDELTINMRQKNDKQYSELLSRIRVGWATNDDIQLLNKRKISFSSNDREQIVEEICLYIEKLPDDTVCLVPTRMMCKILNTAMLDRLSAEEIHLIAQDSFKCQNQKTKAKINKMLINDTHELCAVERLITVKIGARVRIKRNIDVTNGLVNGALATIISVTKDNSGEIDNVKIRLDATKLEYSLKQMEFKFIPMDTVCVIRKQFPFVCSYAITIHCSQGLSLKNACIDLGNSVFAYGQTYVALSRLTELRGLHLINFDPSKIIASQAAIREYNKLRSLYRPDLLPFELSNKVMIKQICCDNSWALSKALMKAQENSIDAAVIKWNFHGLANKSSDYVNVTLQSLFNSESLRRVFLESKDNSIIKRLFELYKSKVSIDTTELKKFVDDKYLLPLNYDVSEFLSDLLIKVPILPQIFGQEFSTTLRCKNCDDERITTAFITRCIIPLALPSNNPCTLQEICDHNFENWTEVDRLCSKADCANRLIRRYQVKLVTSSLILKFEVLSENHKKNFKVNDSHKLIIIRNVKFRVVSAILHHGDNVRSGYYENILRQGKKWVKVCNQIIKDSSWPRSSKDVYIIFLERINK